MVTAEIAVALPILLVVAVSGVMAVAVAQARVRCADAATQAARAVARGADPSVVALAAAGGPVSITVVRSGGLADVTAQIRMAGIRGLPLIEITERAAVAIEPTSVASP